MPCCHYGGVRGKRSWLTAELTLRRHPPKGASIASDDRQACQSEQETYAVISPRLMSRWSLPHHASRYSRLSAPLEWRYDSLPCGESLHPHCTATPAASSQHAARMGRRKRAAAGYPCVPGRPLECAAIFPAIWLKSRRDGRKLSIRAEPARARAASSACKGCDMRRQN